jgi:hypothetical protein
MGDAYCLEPGKIDALKMLDLQNKYAMKLVFSRVSVQATSRAFRITDTQYFCSSL